MYSFKNDYSELACPEIMELLSKSIGEQNIGYGLDNHSLKAQKLIKKYIDKDCDIHFVSGGTIANKLVIDHLLRPYEAVISVSSGHINVHETGAIESTGHKVVTLPNASGKLTAEMVKKIVDSHIDEHMVKPKMIYISNSTEMGTVYTKEELQKLRDVCNQYGLYFYMDGARLGSALVSPVNDLTINDIANLVDVFYIGGTKNGAMLGEAIVIMNDNLKKEFRYAIKHNGAMLSKGFVCAMQFEALFQNDTFFRLARHANECAMKLKKGLLDLKIALAYDSYTNQQYPILSKKIANKLSEKYLFEVWEELDNGDLIVRFCTSWATNPSQIDNLLSDLKSLI